MLDNLVHDYVFSSREGVNVLMWNAPKDSGGHGEYNNHFPRARGDVREYIRECVTDMVTERIETHGRAYGLVKGDPFTVYIREDYSVRGQYTYSVYKG